MNQMKCLFEELDDDTRGYLREVRNREGGRSPGVYFARTNAWPAVAVVLGPVVLIGTLLYSFQSGKAGWAVALLQTAGVLLGGWLTVYAFRRWFARGSDRFAGFFTYFDPKTVYQANGEELTVTDVSEFAAVETKHSYTNGTYSGSKVVFELEARRPFVVPVSGEAKADLVQEYYNSVVWLEEQADKKWQNLPTAELGGVAKYVAVEEALPADMADVPLEVTAAPDEPHRARRAGPNLLPYLMLFGLGGITYLGFWALNAPMQDELEFARAKENGAAGLRNYLLDDRNTRHRDEAKEMLGRLYEPAVAKVQAGKNPALKAKLLAILDTLRETATHPVVSLEVREVDGPPADNFSGPLTRTDRLRTELADALGQHLGRELIAFVQPLDNRPAYFDLAYRFKHAPQFGDAMPQYVVSWQLRLRNGPDDQVAEGQAWTIPGTFSPTTFRMLPDQIKAAVFDELFGQPPPVVIPVAPAGGDFGD